jgi:hypothetical protein
MDIPSETYGYQRAKEDGAKEERQRIIKAILNIPLPKKSWYEDYREIVLLYAKEILKAVGYENWMWLYYPYGSGRS